MGQLIEFAGNHGMLVAGFAGIILLLIWTEISKYTRGYTELTPLQLFKKSTREKPRLLIFQQLRILQKDILPTRRTLLCPG